MFTPAIGDKAVLLRQVLRRLTPFLLIRAGVG